MRYEDYELVDRIAREYVVGTLRGRARARFEAVMRTNATARSCVQAWEDRLLPLSLELAPVVAQASVWRKVEGLVGGGAGGARQDGGGAVGRGLRPFRWAIAAMLALAAVGLGWLLITSPGSPTSIAVLAPEGKPAIWNVETFPDRESIRIVALSPVPVEPGKSYELWALPDGGAPVSLGLMPAQSESGDSTPRNSRHSRRASRSRSASSRRAVRRRARRPGRCSTSAQ